MNSVKNIPIFPEQRKVPLIEIDNFNKQNCIYFIRKADYLQIIFLISRTINLLREFAIALCNNDIHLISEVNTWDQTLCDHWCELKKVD